MGSGKEKNRESAIKATKNLKKSTPFGPNKAKTKRKKEDLNKSSKTNVKKSKTKTKTRNNEQNDVVIPFPTASQQLKFFQYQYESANRVQLSSLELESFTATCMIEVNPDQAQTSTALGEHVKVAFGPSWKNVLCEKDLDDKIDPGSPALLVVSLSALRSLELYRELRPLTSECHAAKLFSKHMKIEEQVSFLKNRVNVASGTPSRIKKLIDLEALGVSRLAVVVVDMKTDVKGYSLLTLPQVRDEFWDLYKSYFHQRVLEGSLRICLYGDLPAVSTEKKTNEDD